MSANLYLYAMETISPIIETNFGLLILLPILVLIINIFFVVLNYKKAKPGIALIRYGVGGTKVSFNGMMRFPILHKLYEVDTSMKPIKIVLDKQFPVYTKDNKALEGEAVFWVKINSIEDDVCRVCHTFSVDQTFDKKFLDQFFAPFFKSALQEVIVQVDHYTIMTHMEECRMKIIQYVGTELNGYVLDELTINLKR